MATWITEFDWGKIKKLLKGRLGLIAEALLALRDIDRGLREEQCRQDNCLYDIEARLRHLELKQERRDKRTENAIWVLAILGVVVFGVLIGKFIFGC